MPKFPVEIFPGAHAVVDLPRAHALIESYLEPLRHRRILPEASAPLFPTTVESLYTLPSSLTRADDAIDHASVVPKIATSYLRPQQHCPPQARNAIDPHRPQACSIVVLPKLATLSSTRCPRAYDAVKPAPSLSPQRHHPPQAHKVTILYIFLCHFGPTNSDFDMLHYRIALICYITFVLVHCFDVLHCI
jgi:hypothetical protein